MEHSKNEKIQIPRNSPVIRVNLGKTSLDLTWYNSTIYEHAHPYQNMDHVFIRYPSAERPGRTDFYNIFGNQALRDCLKENNYPLLKTPEPTDSDVESYVEWTEKQLGQELGELFDE